MKILSLFFLIFLTVSCHDGIRKPPAPKDLISEVKMKEIIKDLILIEGHIALTYKQLQSYHKIITVSSSEVYKKHKVSKDRYVRSFEYYAADQEKLTQIYTDVLDQLTEDKGKLNSN